MDKIPENETPQPADSDDGLEPVWKILEPVELTDRDRAVFKFCHEHRYLAYGQIREGFWRDRSEPAKACYRRVERLINSGYLRRSYSPRKSMNIYLATEKSLAILKERGLDSDIPLYVPTPYFDRAIDHDLKLVSVRILFRGLGLHSWTSERVLRERDHLQSVPDALLNVRGKRIAIELENHLTKSMVRYQAMFDEYGDHQTYLVLFMIIDGDTKDWLVQGLEYNTKRIWITTYQELIKDKENTLFENKRFSFRLSRLL